MMQMLAFTCQKVVVLVLMVGLVVGRGQGTWLLLVLVLGFWLLVLVKMP
jgi:hypothetical protein